MTTPLSDPDRDSLVAVLREHYATGRFDLPELDRRVGAVLAARYAEEAAAAVADLPPLPAAAGSASGKSGRHRHGQSSAPKPGWLRTDERFRDPTSGKIMRVWTDPSDHSRHYVPED